MISALAYAIGVSIVIIVNYSLAWLGEAEYPSLSALVGAGIYGLLCWHGWAKDTDKEQHGGVPYYRGWLNGR